MPVENPGIDPVKMRKWMVVCWNTAIETCQDYGSRDYTPLKEKI
jgi:hypothetical protein